jgi:hypothetical protein
MGERLSSVGYEFLQSRLFPRELPVAVVDISNLKPAKIEVDDVPREVTPRPELRSIVSAVAEQDARVIGVDVNFAPLHDGTPITPEDSGFFQFCRDMKEEKPMRRGVPVVLGVDWARDDSEAGRRPEDLIENESYKDLFAHIRTPRLPENMPYKFNYNKDNNELVSVPTMAAALADAFRQHDAGSKHSFQLPSWAARQFSKKELKDDLSVIEFPVDFSVIRSFLSRDNTLRPAEVDIIRKQGSMLRDKIVLIGKASPGPDQFRVPLDEEELFPGVYLHATAAYTLINPPLLRMTAAGAIVLDFLLAFVVLLAVTAIRWHYKDRTAREVAKHRLEKIFTFLVALVAIVAAVLFVNYHRVVWPDFVIVIPMLLLHRPIEQTLLGAWSFLRRKTPDAIDAVVFEKEGGNHK